MKLEIGMYIRITKSFYIDLVDATGGVDCKKGNLWKICNTRQIEILKQTDPNNLKASTGLIDLIEVGDYVNGCKVDEISINGLCLYSYAYDLGSKPIEPINSIVTKEQFDYIKLDLKGE